MDVINKFKHKVIIEVCDSERHTEILLWLYKNHFKHTSKWSHSIEQYEIYFKHQNDAVAFKLRWL